MAWTKYTTRYLRKTWQADVLAALGKTCHVVGLGLILGMLIGTWSLAAPTVLTIACVGVAGVVSNLAAASLRRSAEKLPEAEESRRLDERILPEPTMEVEPTVRSRIPMVDLIEMQRQHSAAVGRAGRCG